MAARVRSEWSLEMAVGPLDAVMVDFACELLTSRLARVCSEFVPGHRGFTALHLIGRLAAHSLRYK